MAQNDALAPWCHGRMTRLPIDSVRVGIRLVSMSFSSAGAFVLWAAEPTTCPRCAERVTPNLAHRCGEPAADKPAGEPMVQP